MHTVFMTPLISESVGESCFTEASANFDYFFQAADKPCPTTAIPCHARGKVWFKSPVLKQYRTFKKLHKTASSLKTLINQGLARIDLKSKIFTRQNTPFGMLSA